jgi:GNAT superfamily N-acetyltransferase
MKQFVDLYNLGWASPYFSASNFSRAVYAEINQRVVGHIVYNVLDKGIRTAWICLSAVDPDYRQCGIYKLMHTQFEAEAKRIGCGKIASFVHVDNLPRIKGCESVGMEPKFYKMEKDL